MITVLTKYETGHSRESEWEKGDLYCPSCGAREVYEEQSGGDYYQGADYLCIKCTAVFTIQGPYLTESKDERWQTIEQIQAYESEKIK